MEITDYLHNNRPALSKSSLITYTSILKNLYYKVFEKKNIDLKDFNNTDEILKYLKNIPPNRRKTILSALVIITDNKKYRELMLEDVRDYNNEIHKQEKTPEQQASWVNTNQVNDIWLELKKDADLLYKKKDLKKFHPTHFT
jgi:phage-related protein